MPSSFLIQLVQKCISEKYTSREDLPVYSYVFMSVKAIYIDDDVHDRKIENRNDIVEFN